MSFPGAKNTLDLTAPWTTWFLFGDSGSGKTTAAATFPRPFFIVPKNEQSVTTLMGLDFPYVLVTGSDGPYFPKKGEGGMVKIIDMLLEMYRKDPAGFPYDTIVPESMTHYSDMALQDFEGRGKGQQVWGMLSNHLRWIHNQLRSMDVHVVYTALADIKGGEDSNAQVGAPMLSGKQQFKLPAACDAVGYLEAGSGTNPRYRAHFERFKCYTARTRFKAMPKVIENFTFSKVEPFLTVKVSEEQEAPTAPTVPPAPATINKKVK